MSNKRILAKALLSAALSLTLAPILPTLAQNRAIVANETFATVKDQPQLIELLKSDAPKAEKALACKKLVTAGTRDCIPAVAALLPDPELNSWARITLEAIPDPAADDALRDAIGKTEGRQLVGVINSLGYRRDAKAIEQLIPKLKDSDAQIVASAAAALGRIGGVDAAKALEESLASAPADRRSAIAEGAVVCAERFMLSGNGAEAIKLYDTIRKADLPKQRIIEATRGAILARQLDGIPLLVETLRNADKAIFDIGLRAGRELQGPQVTEALMAELPKAPAERQDLILFALGDRGDARALPVVLQALKSGPVQAQVGAAMVLETLGDPSVLPALLEAATGENADVAKAARNTLARMRGQAADQALFAAMQESTGTSKAVLIELVEQRRLEGAVPLFLKFASDADPQVRRAALDAVGAIGTDQQVPQLIDLLKSGAVANSRADAEKALMSICARYGSAILPQIRPLISSPNTADRILALRALSSCGGGEALTRVTDALADKDESVQDEAVRTLSNWPNRWPEDQTVVPILIKLAKSGAKPTHQVLAQRGYIQFVQGSKALNNQQRLQMIDEILPLLTRAEEKRSAISALGNIRTAAALDKLVEFANEEAVAEEANSAILNLLSRGAGGIPRAKREAALQAVVKTSKSEATKKRAQDALKGL